MSPIELIYNEELQNLDTVILRLEGVFYKAYEHSAYILSTNVKPFKPNKKLYKRFGKEIVSVGFPKASLEKYMSGRNLEFLDNGVVRVIFDSKIDFTAFELWKQNIPLNVSLANEDNTCSDRIQVYADAYDFFLRIHNEVVNISNISKQILGKDIESNAFTLIKLIHKANLQKDYDLRVQIIDSALELIDEVGLTLRILKDLHEITIRHYMTSSEKLYLIYEQLQGWKKYTQKQKSQTS